MHDTVSVKFDDGEVDRMKVICDRTFWGMSVSDYIRRVVRTEMKRDEEVLKSSDEYEKRKKGVK